MSAWRPASGYRTKSGAELWRVWNDTASPHLAELKDRSGRRPRLFRTYDSALRVALELNRKG